MADLRKENFDDGSEFNFEALEEFESKPASDAPEETDPFGSAGENAGFSFEDTDSEKPLFEEDTTFGDTEFDPGSAFEAPGDNPFDFGGPPSPESVELENLSGDPDEEFGDFGTEEGNFFEAQGKNADDNPFDGDDQEQGDYPTEGAVDPFADDADDTNLPVEEDEPAPAAAPSKGSVKQYASIAAVVAVVGFVGYSQVLPIFMSQESEPVMAESAPVIEQGSLPLTLPSTETNVTPVETPTVDIVEIAKVDPVTGEPQAELPALDFSTPSNSGAEVENPLEKTDSAPELTLAIPEATATTPTAVDPMEDLVGGTDRGGLASMKNEAVNVPEAQITAAADQLDALAERLDEVVSRIEKIERQVAGLAEAPITKPETTVSGASVSIAVDKPLSGAVDAPLKPPIIESVVLRGVSRDIAWIAVGKEVREVKVGDTVAEAGTIESFQNYRGRWIAVTDKGIILPK